VRCMPNGCDGVVNERSTSQSGKLTRPDGDLLFD
jgi:hypothetical protein